MPAIIDDSAGDGHSDDGHYDSEPELPFPPITKSHILNCSFHYWHSQYRSITPKARVVPLPKPFIDYLKADGIVLPSDTVSPGDQVMWSDPGGSSDVYGAAADSSVSVAAGGSVYGTVSFSGVEASDSDDEDEGEDVAKDWRQVHEVIKDTIRQLGGRVMPKLNWSAPKDATFMNANTMDCRSPQEIYLLLKSSDFITHDLDHAFDGCVDSPDSEISQEDIPYCLVLRKTLPAWNPSVEFRCFVRERKLLGISQRERTHFEFLFQLEGRLRSLINEFFEIRLQDTFDEENFVFDVYVPQPYDRVWLVDINPWAPWTDPLLFDWLELLTMDDPPQPELEPYSPKSDVADYGEAQFHRMTLNPPADLMERIRAAAAEIPDEATEDEDGDEEADEELWLPELRLIRRDDPEAFSFATPQYSAHKLPKDVVDASQSGEGLREFARDWQNILEQRQKEDAAAESDED